MANMSGALVAHEPKTLQINEPPQISQQTQVPSIKIEEVLDDEEKVVLQPCDVEDEDFYTVEEMESMDNPTMTYMAKRETSHTSLRVKHLGSAKEIHQGLLVVPQEEDTRLEWWIDQSLDATTVMNLVTFSHSAEDQDKIRKWTKGLVISSRKVKEKLMWLKENVGVILMMKKRRNM